MLLLSIRSAGIIISAAVLTGWLVNMLPQVCSYR
jgi:hypothetical protein